MAGKKMVRAGRGKALRSTFEAQSPFDGIMANVFNDMGGEKRLLKWAKENEGTFYKMMIKLRPNVAPSSGHNGEVVISINNHLQPSPLDGEEKEVVTTVISEQ